jgi:hypothetical protein
MSNFLRNALFGLLIFGSTFQAVANTAMARDSSTLADTLKKGKVTGFARYFFSATDNADQLSDYHAHGLALGVGYETPVFRGFKAGLSGSFTYNLESSDLTRLDPSTGQPNRYEIGLFDSDNLGSHRTLSRLEKMFIQYNHKGLRITFGKQLLKTPFLNPQDGRLRPTLVEGVTGEWIAGKNWTLQGAWIYGISPRGNTAWFGLGESMGKFPQGVNPDGTKSGYAGNLKNDGLAFLSVERKLGKRISVQLFDQYVLGMFNTALGQLNTAFPLNSKGSLKLIAAGQFIAQQAVEDGGNAIVSKTYMLKNNRASVYSFRLGLAHGDSWSVLLNYTRISEQGRYLMPREWGRDPMFTFMPRERNEGYGDVRAMNLMLSKSFAKTGLKIDLGYGQYLLPDVTNTALNKYGMPSYQQLNFDVRYAFRKYLKGLEAQLLFVYKGKLGETYGNNKFILNKVNMCLFNGVLNYNF